ncbi:MAG TPA: hypothetical protein VGJ13_12660 [Pseudonocardiaceae bacterium]|jgi:hypothetical protein
MPYEAVSAYTVLVGETDGTTTVTVHGSADQAWRALAEAVRGRSTRWMPRNDDAAALADRWRQADPQRRFWQVSSHQLQVMVPASMSAPTRPAGACAVDTDATRPRRHWRHGWRNRASNSAM